MVILLLSLLLPFEMVEASKQQPLSALEVGKRYQLSLPENIDINDDATNSNTITANDATQQYHWQKTKVKYGDSLAKIFKRLGFNATTTYQVTHASGDSVNALINLKVGDELLTATDEQGQLIALRYPLNITETLEITRENDNYHANIFSKALENRPAFVSGTIKSNFWNAAADAGLSDNQIINLANIFGWDIDFASDIRANDQFTVMYEKQYIDGEYVGTGNILAAEFINQGEVFQAVRFDDGEYYSPDGKSLRKAFLRAPVNFKYISSNFQKRRFHPIQKRWKAHNGIDYRANTGTPVVAAGNGRVIKSSYNRFNGNYVFIQHGNNIVTKYLHFSKRAVKAGERVKQGQVIGYVGATGLAEAPHLHYEFLVNGVHRNPRTVKLPDANPIDRKHKAAFMQLATTRLQQLAASKNTLLAHQVYWND